MSKQNEQTVAVASVKPVHVQEQNALEALGVEFTLSSTAPAYPRLPRNKAWFVSTENGFLVVTLGVRGSNGVGYPEAEVRILAQAVSGHGTVMDAMRYLADI